MKYLLKIMFICLFFLIIGCTKNSTENTDFTNGELAHPIQCKAVNLSCDDRLEKSVKCKGIAQTTKERCNNDTRNACNYCYLHTDQAPLVGQCLNQTKNASGYCEYHKDLAK